MESNTTKITNTAQVQSDEISLKEVILKIRRLFHFLLSKWKTILLVGILGSILGFVYAHARKPVYTATCTFVLDEGKSSGGLGQYAGLAAMAGINIGGGASDGLFQGDNILELYKSRRMLQKTLLSYGEFNGKIDLLINRYVEINNLREAWEEKPKTKGLRFDIPRTEYSRLHDSVIGSIVSDINKNYLSVSKLDRKLNILKVDVKSEDEQFAKNFNDQVVTNVNAFYTETKTKKQEENIHILKNQADSVRAVLNTSIAGTATSLDANPNANAALQILRVPSQRKQIDVQANSAIYAEVIKNLEMAKLAALQDAPLIQVVDSATYPLEKASIGKLKGLLMGMFIGVFISCVILTLRTILLTYKYEEK